MRSIVSRFSRYICSAVMAGPSDAYASFLDGFADGLLDFGNRVSVPQSAETETDYRGTFANRISALCARPPRVRAVKPLDLLLSAESVVGGFADLARRAAFDRGNILTPTKLRHSLNAREAPNHRRSPPQPRHPAVGAARRRRGLCAPHE